MSNGRQASGARWVGFRDCEAHVITENGECPICRIESLQTESLQTEVDRYRDAIKKWLDGDYPNPRRNRPHDCKHGVGYWQSCDNCEEEYWQSVIEPTTLSRP